MREFDRQSTSTTIVAGRCECGHVEEEHNPLGPGSECLHGRACECRAYRPQSLATVTLGAERGMYTSEPIPGVQSPFYAGDRYYADVEDARRARMDLAERDAGRPSLAIVARDLSAPDARRATPRPPARLTLVRAGGQR